MCGYSKLARVGNFESKKISWSFRLKDSSLKKCVASLVIGDSEKVIGGDDGMSRSSLCEVMAEAASVAVNRRVRRLSCVASLVIGH